MSIELLIHSESVTKRKKRSRVKNVIITTRKKKKCSAHPIFFNLSIVSEIESNVCPDPS